MIRMRVINRPLALVLAAALVAASVIVIAEVIAFAVHAGPVILHWPAWYSWATRTHWNALVIKVWSVILIIVGTIVLAFELKPRKITRLRLRSEEKATDAAMTRKGLAGALRAAALDIDGISSAAVKVRRRRARVAATSVARGRGAADALKEPVAASVRQHLEDLEMLRPPRLTVRVVPRSR
jgi:Family of unknown function (DUF6286)